jgi:DNA invertase Pin-like site-specific DNA recombinase
MIVGYARVSTSGQELKLQQEELRAAGCEKVYFEKASGARADRPQLGRMLKALSPGDVVVVARLDRLARSSRDLLNLIHQIDEAGATFQSLADAWCDTTTAHGRLILTVLAGLSEFERSLIMARTQAGIERVRALGKAFGRPGKLNVRQKRMVAERYAAGETVRSLADTFGVGAATIHRALQAGNSKP